MGVNAELEKKWRNKRRRSKVLDPQLASRLWNQAWELYLADRKALGYDTGKGVPTSEQMRRKCDF